MSEWSVGYLAWWLSGLLDGWPVVRRDVKVRRR